MLSDYQRLAFEYTRDDAGKIAPAEYERAITAAVARYSKDFPRETAEDLTPSDANTLPLPAAWEADFSEIRSLEYPIGDIPPTLVNQERYGLYRRPAGLVILLLDAVAVAAANVRAVFTVSHLVSQAQDTIPVQAREPVACWAAAICCNQLAALYSGGTDSTIQADSVQNASKASDYARRAKDLRARYFSDLGIEDDREAPAGTVVNLDFPDSLGQDRIYHRSGLR